MTGFSVLVNELVFSKKKKRMDLGQFENNFPFDVEDSFELPLRPRSELVTVDSR